MPSEARQALRTEGAVDALLGGAPVALPDAASAPEPDVVLAARRLAAEVVRPHPSFRFEERLAARLLDEARGAAAASPGSLPGARVGTIHVLPRPISPSPALRTLGDRLAALPATARGRLAGVPALSGWPGLAEWPALPGRRALPVLSARPVLVGGASAISLAGAAWLAWRLSRADEAPMIRAARAAHLAERMVARRSGGRGLDRGGVGGGAA